MAMTIGGNRGQLNGQMNVTPMVDILLVLLVIFMIVQTKKPDGLEAQIPQPADKQTHSKRDDTPIVVQVRYSKGNAPALLINHVDVRWEDLQGRLHDIYKARANKTMFVEGDKDVEFANVARVLDIARATELSISVGLITQSTQGD